jgi:hypothetical protein
MPRRLIPRIPRPASRPARPGRHRPARLAAVLTSLMLVPLAVVGAASPAAAAAACAQPGHAYLIHEGRAYYSGYEGDYRFGIQYLVLPRGTAVQVGAAGLKPGFFGEFDLYPGDTVPPGWFYAQRLTRPQVGGNCVINQQWVYPHPSLVGTYQLRVNYVAGNSGAPVQETEVFVIFI